jgi:Fe-Mn family superoxide dismutase
MTQLEDSDAAAARQDAGAPAGDRYALPKLPYALDALEPHISAAIMELHHDKHHRAYVEGANKALAALDKARLTGELSAVSSLERDLAFNVSGHVLHSIFWQNLAPGAGGLPGGALARTIDRDFRSFEALEAQLIRAASTIMGSGWAALTWDPVLRRLATTQIHDHQSEVTQAGIPLLVIDAWEHAYYLQYRNEKARFFEALFHLWNWDDVAMRLAQAQRLDLGITDAAAWTLEGAAH